VNGQTSIIGSNSVDIRTEKNTDVQGAVIAAENGNLKLDTDTLTYRDIYDHNTGSNTQVGVSVPLGSAIGAPASTTKSSTGEADGKQNTTPPAAGDSNKEPSALASFLGSSNLDGSYDSHDSQQVNRATIGEGTIVIRSDPTQGLEGLNRDLKRAQEITKNSKTSVKVYVDPAAIKEVLSGFGTTKASFKALSALMDQILATPMTREEIVAKVRELTASGKITPKEASSILLSLSLTQAERRAAEDDLSRMKVISDVETLNSYINNLTPEQRAAVAAVSVTGKSVEK
jgi:filamentous hemagglutinin